MSDRKMLTCANCGNERPEGTRFCANCGTPFAQAEAQVPPAEPPPTTSSTRKRRLVWVAAGTAVALLVAGGAAAAFLITGGDDSTPAGLDSITNTTDVFPTNDATTTESTDAIGQGVEETCKDFLAFFAFSKDADLPRGGNSVDDLETAAAAASELADKAPAVLRSDLTSIADANRRYIDVLSELNLEPGPDALLVPEVEDALSGQTTSDIEEFLSQNCNEEDFKDVLSG